MDQGSNRVSKRLRAALASAADVAPTVAASAAVAGFYADPAIVVLDGRFWLYPTTDGTEGWTATSFHAFSSTDLVAWTDHGEVFAVNRDTVWASGHAWAPAMVCRGDRYYLYFTADDSIGVAVGTAPTGPFEDLGVPLVAAGRFPGAAIDPAVFVDDDGTPYLYWGNTVAHGVRLNEDMTGFDPAQVRSWKPTGFREAAWVHRRGDVYYLSWSENDTREADYRVRYAEGPGPLGPWTDRGVLLAKDAQRGVLGTGHHSIVRAPGTDAWYIAYHRFAIPNGDGHHREIAIDPLVHLPDGRLEPVLPRGGARHTP